MYAKTRGGLEELGYRIDVAESVRYAGDARRPIGA
jgi:hypothetical protein